MRKTQANPALWILSFLGFASLMTLAAARALPAQDLASLVLIGVDPDTGALVPVDLELVRRPGELRLDPETGRLAGTGELAAGAAFLAFEPSSGAFVAVDLQPVRGTGAFDLDPQTGALTVSGPVVPFRAVAEGPTLVGFEPGTGALAPVELGLARLPGSYAINPRTGVLSPTPREPLLVGFDVAAGTLVLVRLSPARGAGALSVDPRTGSVSRVVAPSAPPPGDGDLTLLGTRSDGGLAVVVPDFVQLGGILALDPQTRRLQPSRQEARVGHLTILGAHYPTGALTHIDVEAVLQPGEYAVDLPTGTLSRWEPGPESDDRAESGFVFGGGFEARQMLKLKDVLADVPGATDPDASELAPGIHAFAEYLWRAISIGAEAGYSVMDAEVRFPQGLQTGDLTYFEIGGNVKLAVPLEGPVRPYGTFAILRAWTEGVFEIEDVREERTHETTRGGIGAGLDYQLVEHWGLRIEGLYSTTFEDGDAAEHIRWRVGATYSPEEFGGGLRD